jgi:hypothetical protein
LFRRAINSDNGDSRGGEYRGKGRSLTCCLGSPIPVRHTKPLSRLHIACTHGLRKLAGDPLDDCVQHLLVCVRKSGRDGKSQANSIPHTKQGTDDAMSETRSRHACSSQMLGFGGRQRCSTARMAHHGCQQAGSRREGRPVVLFETLQDRAGIGSTDREI